MSQHNEDPRSRVRSLCFWHESQKGISEVERLIKENHFQPNTGYAIEWLREQKAAELFESIAKDNTKTSKVATMAAVISALCALFTIIFSYFMS
jgi:hypothetical protein